MLFNKFLQSALIFILIVTSYSCALAQINWIDFNTAIERQAKIPKKILVDVYTDWCGYCKKMDRSTFTDSAVIDFINNNYYAVKLNAESKDTFYAKGKMFIYKPEYKSNELAINLLYGKMGYPTLVIIDEQNLSAKPHPGYKSPENLLEVLRTSIDN